MLKSIIKKLFFEFIAKKFGLKQSYKYSKPKKHKGLAYKLKKIFD
jgi:hypothetical protein